MKSWFVLDHDVYTENDPCLTEYYEADEVRQVIAELEAENQKLREQIQLLNAINAGH